MLTVSGGASGFQAMKSRESLEGAETAATDLGGGDVEDVENSGTIVTMRGGGDSRPRNHHRRKVSWQGTPPNTSPMTPHQRGRSLDTAGRVAPSQRQSASAQQTPNARG